MAVYVDTPRHPLKQGYRRMLMCHLIADTEAEMHAMADAIGVDRRHYQVHTKFPHYDICKAKRALAIELGAIEVSSKDIVRVGRRLVQV